MASKNFNFRKEGKSLNLSFSQCDITVSRLATAFQVEPDSLFLKEEFGDQSFWPNETGRFNLSQLYDGVSLQVMGNTPTTTTTAIASSSSVASYSATKTQPATFALKGNWGKKSTFSCKIIFATMEKNGKGQPQFTEQKQTFITLNEHSANLPSVTEQAKKKFGEDVLLVAGNGLAIEDEVGTQGLSFWKCPSRKLYAIPNPKRKAAVLSLTPSDDSEDEKVPQKRMKSKVLKELGNDVSAIANDVFELKESVAALISVNNTIQLPLSLAKLVRDSFKCKICHTTPMIPPVVASRCCNVLLGCSTCITQLYQGEGGLEKSCPNCREARGYAHTVQFKGLDEFLEGFSKAMKTDN